MPKRIAFDSARLQKLLAAHNEVISRSQALACGIPRSTITTWCKPNGKWQKLLPGIYLTVTGKPTLDQRAVAALLYAGPRSVITGPTAIRQHRLRSPGPDTIDVLVPWTVKRQSTGFVQIHRTRRMPRFHATGAIRFAVTARAVADAARGFTSLDDVRAVVAEAVQKRHCTIAEIGHELEAGPSRGAVFLRTALAEVRAGIRSAAEARFLKLIKSSDLPMPMFNAWLATADGTFIAEVDAWWADAGVAVEIDSQEFHFYRADWLETNARHSRMLKHGILPHHFPPSRISTDPDGILDELRSSIGKGLQRPRLPIVAMPPPG
jgi:hypothetical protein